MRPRKRSPRVSATAASVPRTVAIVADTAEQANELASSSALSFLRLRTGRPGLLPSVEEALSYPYTDLERAQVQAARARSILGTPAMVRARLDELVTATGASEVMVTSMIHNHAARLRSFELLAEAFALVPHDAPQPVGV